MISVEHWFRVAVLLGAVGVIHALLVWLWNFIARKGAFLRGRRPPSFDLSSAPRESGRKTRNLFVRHLTSAAGALVIVIALLNFHVYHGFNYQPDVYRRGNRGDPWVAITFDDGPSPEFTPRILDILSERSVPATFFMVGEHVKRYPELARSVAERGFEVGNHTWSHLNVPTASTQTLYDELLRTTGIIWQETGEYPQFSRPPRGLYDGRFRRLAELLGQPVVLWSVSSRDWRLGRSADAIVREVVGAAKAGDILLFHDSGALIRDEGASREATVLALPRVIDGIRAKGLEFVSLSQLLSDVEGEVNPPTPPVQE